MKKIFRITAVVAAAAILGWCLFTFIEFEYAYIPPDRETRGKERNSAELLSVSSKAETGSDEQLKLGKKMFFAETFGNEVFFTDILGMFDGAFTLSNITKAIIQLHGEGTSSLKVEAAQSFQAGGVSIKKGDLIDTGLDVAKGTYVPLGVKFVVDEGRMKAGVSCAACHASVDGKGNVLPGIPNTDLNIGLILAMSSNSASYFTHTEMKNLREFMKKADEISKEKQQVQLPDAEKLEKFVDAEFVKWPRGSNDTTIDLENNPVQVSDSFTLGDQPYGWSGQGQVGPFKGLSALINNTHSQNMDAVSQSSISGPVLGIDKDVYLGTLLQRAAYKKYRYDPTSKETPSAFFAKVDPTPGVPGVNRMIPAATYPKISYLSSVGLLPSASGYKAWEQVNAMSAYTNSLQPPSTGLKTEAAVYEEGKRVFAKAGCISCHAGEYLTNNQLIKPGEIGTDPSRAAGFKRTEKYFTSPKMYPSDTPVPLPKHPKKEDLQPTPEQEKHLKLSWAHGNSSGAYKVPSLYGLYWSAPYLHDAGVAVGSKNELGVSNTLMQGKKADAVNSLQALVDSKLRRQVIQENLSDNRLRTAHISGNGHEFWVDETTGFTSQEQQALIHYLLRFTDE